MNNSVFGKTMENLRKRISVRLVNNAEDYVQCRRKASFYHRKYLLKVLLLFMKENKTVLTLIKPIYVVFGILDLSKYLMYEFN